MVIDNVFMQDVYYNYLVFNIYKRVYMGKIKELFPEYYDKNDEYFEKLWETSIFVFDTSVLLDIYSYSENFVGEIIKIIKNLSGRVWLPYQVMLEYQDNRIKTINALNDSFKQIEKVLIEGENKIADVLRHSFSVHPTMDINEIIGELKNYFDKIKEKLEKGAKNVPNYLEKDRIREEIENLFEDKIGEPHTSEEIMRINELGKKRYEQKIPPGFRDKYFNDLIIWLEIIKKAKETEKDIIFVTNDLKEDWWSKEKDNKIKGPCIKLMREFRIESGKEFYMYRLEVFYKRAAKYFKEKYNEEFTEEIIKSRSLQDNIEILKREQEALNAANNWDALKNKVMSQQKAINVSADWDALAEVVKRQREVFNASINWDGLAEVVKRQEKIFKKPKEKNEGKSEKKDNN